MLPPRDPSQIKRYTQMKTDVSCKWEGKKAGTPLLISDKRDFKTKTKRTKMAAQVDTLCLLAQPELTENQMTRKSDTKEIKNKHSSRPVGGAETGNRGREDSRCRGGTETGRVWDKQGRQSDH